MGFRDLFKVRQPGHGNNFEQVVKNAIKTARAKRIKAEDNSQNAGKKKSV